MVLQRWEPFWSVDNRRGAVDRLFPASLHHPSLGQTWDRDESSPSLDVYHTADALVVKAAVPGVKPADIEVTLIGNVLTIKGEIHSEDAAEERYLVRERRSGEFQRRLALPKGLSTNQIEATYEDGVLTLVVPKAEETKPQVIKVQVKEPQGKEQAA